MAAGVQGTESRWSGRSGGGEKGAKSLATQLPRGNVEKQYPGRDGEEPM